MPSTENDRKSDNNNSTVTVNNWIGGVSVAPTTGKYLSLINPADGSINGQVALSDSNDIELAVEAGKKALIGWQKLTVKSRVQFLYKFRALIIEHQDELAKLISLEHGKTYGEAVGDVQKGNETVEWACSLPQVMQGKNLEVSSGIVCHDTREPHGIVASIVPFNFPFMVPMWTVPIAVGCGNVVIIKPSEKVPLTLNRVMGLVKEAGFPDGVIQIVNGQAPVVNAICDHPDIKAVSFVGSSKVAEIVSHRCRLLNKRVLALGAAKNHLVALPDCNEDMCSSDIVASFTGCTGQRCMAASALILVTEQKQLLQTIVDKAAKLVAGQETGKIGPLIDDVALKRVHKYIDEAEASGAKILLDGRSWTKNNPKGFWIGPTIILHKSASEPAFTDEIFGPVLSVVIVQTKEAAIEIENKSPYGNAAAVYTTTGSHAEWFVSRFHTGHVGVNIGVPVPREPFSFGGWNASKYGDMDITGDGGMEFFTKRKKVTTKWNPPQARAHGDWMS